MEDSLTLRARTHADRPAVIAGGGSASYADLQAAAATAARRLAGAGVRAGDRVATLLPGGLDFAVVLNALPKLGAAIVPLDPRLPGDEVRRRVQEVSARVVVDGPVTDAEADVELRSRVDPNDTQTVLYTSGTAGRPHPVELTYANHRASALASAWNLGVAPDDRWLCPLPTFHIGGLAILLRSPVYGTAVILQERFDVNAVAASLGSGEATVVSLVSTMLRRLARAGLEEAPALRAGLVGGGPVPRELLEWAARRGLPLVQTYGMTETASQVATLPVAEAAERAEAAGRPLPGVELRVSDRGEIHVRGPMVAPSEAGPDGWLRTGDRGRLDDDGYLTVEGRVDDVIVTGGENVAPGVVEEALREHPAVDDAGVVGSRDAEWGEAVTAYVVLRHRATPDDLIDHCRERLSRHEVPKAVHFVDALPRTESGEVLRRALAGRSDASG